MGCHLTIGGIFEGHLQSIHGGVYDDPEHFCVDGSASEDVSVLDANDWIWGAVQGYVGTGWESVPGVGFPGLSWNCDDLTPSDRAKVTIFYYLVDDVPLETSYMQNPYDLAEEHHDHRNWYSVDVVLWTPQLIEGTEPCDSLPQQDMKDCIERFRNHTINHETGHALGLNDPLSNKTQYNPQPPPAGTGALGCVVRFDKDGDTIPEYIGPVPSIMHNGDTSHRGRGWCGDEVIGHPYASFGNYEFPTWFDLTVVELIAAENPWAMDQY